MPWPPDSGLEEMLEIVPEGVRRLYLIGLIQGTADNGGLEQYLSVKLYAGVREMVKRAISEIGCPQMISILEEAERYYVQHIEELRDANTWDDQHKILGMRAMDEALNNITSRYLAASRELDKARAHYVAEHLDKFQ